MDSQRIIGEVPGSSRLGDIRCSYLSRLERAIGLLLLAGLWLGRVAAQAQDATWLASPGSSDWNTGTNWTGATVPTGTATFGASITTTITFSNATFVGTLQFDVAAPAYSFNLTNDLTLTGAGILDNSSNRPTFATNARFIQFSNTSTAGDAVIATNPGGITDFENATTAGNASITNAGLTEFFTVSTAGNATITTNSGGRVEFNGTSTGGQAAFVTNTGGTVDISELSSSGMTAGSIGGAGTYFLGSKALTVGGNNMSTEVSGTIEDGGDSGETGGSLIKVGVGTLTLSGLNTYTGGTTINEGTLQIGDGVTNGSIIGNVTDNATLAFNPNGSVTFDGAISGSGNVVKLGNGTVILTANNTYTGTTTISAGTLQIGNGGISGSIVGNVTDNGFLIFDRQDNITFSGNISGTGSLIQQGPATVTLTGTNSYGGGTVLTDGKLSVDKNTELGAIGVGIGGITLAGGELLTTTNGFNTARAVDVGDTQGANTLAAATGTTATYTGLFSGSGALTVGDTFNNGKVVLASGANTYFGGTTVFRGATLSVDTDAELGNAGGGIILRLGGELLTTANFTSARSVSLNPPLDPPPPPLGSISTPLAQVSRNILAAAANTTAIYTGLVFGTGGLAVGEVSGQNPGVVMLANPANSYTGGTLVQGGAILSVANNSNLGDPTGGVILAGGELLTTASTFSTARAVDVRPTAGRNILAAADATTATYTGILSDQGTLVVGDGTHTGTVVLAGANTYSGGTVIDLGTLLVDNAQALGTGDVIVNGGVLAADPQPINVLGNYTQNAGGTLQLNIAGRAAGQFDVLNVTGNAALNGTLRLINQGYQPESGDKLRLVTSGGVVSGRFAQFQNPFTLAAGFNTINLVYARTSVTLEFLTVNTPVVPVPPVPPVVPVPPGLPEVVMTTDFSSFAFTPNQRGAANLLDAVQLDLRATNLISFLNTESFADLPNDFQKISPESLTAFYEISFSNANIQRLNLEGRLDDLRQGSNGFISNMKVNGATVNVDPRPGGDGKSAKSVVEPILQPGSQNRWGVWVTGFGDFVNVDGDGNAQGYNFTTGGVSIGIDYRITDQLAIGVMGDYSHTWTSLQNNGNIDVNGGRGGLYATWYNHGIYLDAAIYAGHNNYNSSRSGLDGLANGNTGGTEWSTFLSGGYDFRFGPLTVGPIGALQSTYANVSGFSENGSLAPMQIESDSVDSLRSDVGFRLFYQWQIGKILLEPSLKAAWEHEYLYSALPITAGFARIPGPSATFSGPSEGHDSAIVSAGISAQWTPAITTYVNYDGQLGRGNYDSNAVTGGVRISF